MEQLWSSVVPIINHIGVLFLWRERITFPPENPRFCSILSLDRAINQEGLCFVETAHHIPPSEFDALQFGM